MSTRRRNSTRTCNTLTSKFICKRSYRILGRIMNLARIIVVRRMALNIYRRIPLTNRASASRIRLRNWRGIPSLGWSTSSGIALEVLCRSRIALVRWTSSSIWVRLRLLTPNRSLTGSRRIWLKILYLIRLMMLRWPGIRRIRLDKLLTRSSRVRLRRRVTWRIRLQMLGNTRRIWLRRMSLRGRYRLWMMYATRRMSLCWWIRRMGRLCANLRIGLLL